MASVVGRRFPIATVAAIAGVPAETALPLLDSAVRAAILEQDEPGHLRFSHDLFREVVYDGLSAARRPALHISVAGRLEETPTRRRPRRRSPTTAAWHGRSGTATARSLRWSRRPTRRPSGPLSTKRPPTSPCRRRGRRPGSGGPGALCEYGDALRRAGHGEDARAALLGAAERAQAAGDAALFARAAFGTDRVTTVTDCRDPR